MGAPAISIKFHHLQHFFSQNFYFIESGFLWGRWFKSFQLCRNQSDLYLEKKNIKKTLCSRPTDRNLSQRQLPCEYGPPFVKSLPFPPPKKSTNKPTKQRTSTTTLCFFCLFFRIFWASLMGHFPPKTAAVVSRRCPRASSSLWVWVPPAWPIPWRRGWRRRDDMPWQHSAGVGGGWNLNLGEESRKATIFFGGVWRRNNLKANEVWVDFCWLIFVARKKTREWFGIWLGIESFFLYGDFGQPGWLFGLLLRLPPKMKSPTCRCKSNNDFKNEFLS